MKSRPQPPVLFISARFRSGSTLLWHIFREIKGVKAYLEPCHETLPEYIQLQAESPQAHMSLDNYWQEYWDCLDELPNFHSFNFGIKHLYMNGWDEYPELERYINFLITKAKDRMAVLQFNRMDFRLPWLKAKFPQVPILHLYRNPRDQWYSSIQKAPSDHWEDPHYDHFNALKWSGLLSPVFPLLVSSSIKHSYERSYYLWRISKLLGETYADRSISYEDLISHPKKTVQEILSFSGLDESLNQSIVSKIFPASKNKWKNHFDEENLISMEERCEEKLKDSGILQALSEENAFKTYFEKFPKVYSEIYEGFILPLYQAEMYKRVGFLKKKIRRRKRIKFLIKIKSAIKGFFNKR